LSGRQHCDAVYGLFMLYRESVAGVLLHRAMHCTSGVGVGNQEQIPTG